jgi:hypothetical protein
VEPLQISINLIGGPPYSRHAIEDDLDSRLAPFGEVCGAGVGQDFSNIDVEIRDPSDKRQALEVIAAVLQALAPDVTVTIGSTDTDTEQSLADLLAHP